MRKEEYDRILGGVDLENGMDTLFTAAESFDEDLADHVALPAWKAIYGVIARLAAAAPTPPCPVRNEYGEPVEFPQEGE